jgi:hypothetical protein
MTHVPQIAVCLYRYVANVGYLTFIVKLNRIIFYRLNRPKLTLAGRLVKQREGIPIHLDSLLSLFIEEG